MGEYATFTILRKLTKDNGEYQEMKERVDRGSLHTYFASRQIDPIEFGALSFYEIEGETYYSHIPMGFKEVFHQMDSKYNIENKWLLCYTYDEMKASGKDVGYFEAVTTVENAMKRLEALEITDSYWKSQRDELVVWFKLNAELEDLIALNSQGIYYSVDGEFHVGYVKKEINQKIVELKKEMGVPHWNWSLQEAE